MAYVPQPSLALRHGNRRRLLQAELQQRFAGHFYLLAPGEHLHGSSGSGADTRANRRALTASGDSADDRSQSRTAADFFRRVLAPPFALHRVISPAPPIVVAITHLTPNP